MNDSPSTTGLLLFAHGARDPQWARPFEAVAARCKAQRGEDRVALAFLEFMAPDLVAGGSALVGAGCNTVDVVPLFLGAGGHVRQDLPRLLAALQAEYPQLQARLHPAVGEIDSVVGAMAAAAVATLADHQEAA